jgi:hypothetical protein
MVALHCGNGYAKRGVGFKKLYFSVLAEIEKGQTNSRQDISMGAEEETRLYASHHQFYIQDSDPRGSTADSNFWTQEAVDNHLAIAEGIIGIGTGSYDFVKVRVEEHREEPPLDLSKWDHVTEAGLTIRSRVLLVCGCISASGIFFFVRPGHFRVRCCSANLAASTDSTGDAGDWYLVQFWPEVPAEARILKRWIR